MTMEPSFRRLRHGLISVLLLLFSCSTLAEQDTARLAYITSDDRIPFWQIMTRGIEHKATALGYQLQVYSADNSARHELEQLAKVLEADVDGLIISPTTSAAGATLIKLAGRAGIPVVVADIGADSDRYVAFISANNREGAYHIGQVLVEALQQRGWDNGRVGIIAIPQKRLNGQQRTAGFLQALHEADIQNAALRQQVNFSYRETYTFTRELIRDVDNLRAIWLQGSDRYQAALDAIDDAGKGNEILLLTFDAEPEFIHLIRNGTLVGAAMQQPFLMGEQAVETLHRHLQGENVARQQQLPVLAISADNIAVNLETIRRNVLGLEGTH
ncbi:substrate-binding domain-containing protein [Marinobacterium weihaiense]|uniref:Substrate-binding domain-containing protein n=1 Tax=Marinobacterium weihaiense TaxID=2851016 RepID=A0ABS6MDN2_9GAMM|nr:substrate-binding domain-containing protein [Marinobacterium weihaiense]MBV0934416.1 substrate-binding domain-containing protein [Marinobacterium weihaiense]